jgi:hypothetical protein
MAAAMKQTLNLSTRGIRGVCLLAPHRKVWGAVMAAQTFMLCDKRPNRFLAAAAAAAAADVSWLLYSSFEVKHQNFHPQP